jgi:hypothetical protein
MEWFLLAAAALIVSLSGAYLARHGRQEKSYSRPASCAGQNTGASAEASEAVEGVEEEAPALNPADKKQAAIIFVREWLHPSEKSTIRSLIEQHGPGVWIWHLYDEEIADLYPQEKHYATLLSPTFGLGMQVRNALRRAGFGEQDLGVADLQDVYVELLEAAVQQPITCHETILDGRASQ